MVGTSEAMYLDLGDVERHALRQGDILRDIHLLGAITLTQIAYTVDFKQKPIGWSVRNEPKFGSVAVLSHSCEIALENQEKVTSIIVAPLRDVSHATKPDTVDLLKNSNLISEGLAASFLKYFYLEPNPVLPFPQGAVVDFSKCFSLRNKDYGFLLERKRAQLQPEIAEMFALKLALYFHRSQRPKNMMAAGAMA
jgi:hypothetical protein